MTIDPGTKVGARALERLRTELIGWLTTVTPDGQPQSMPVWFLWDGDGAASGEILVYSLVSARRNENLRANPRVSFHFSDDGTGSDVISLEGEARIDAAYPQGEHNPAYVAKYAGLFAEYDWTPAYFSERYNVPVLIRPTKLRGGRPPERFWRPGSPWSVLAPSPFARSCAGPCGGRRSA
jgi:PPOX class probable F420-dependent enzyme